MKVVIIGATGCVGTALLNRLKTKHTIIAGYRSRKGIQHKNITWKKINLFSKNLYKSFKGAHVLIYLVHSLHDKHFVTLDKTLAKHTGKAAKKAGIKKIIYLSGIVPKENISIHLQSRKETGETLATFLPVAEVRASILLGVCSDSFKIVYYLAKRLPVMITPRWVNSPCSPAALDDAVTMISCLISRKLTPHHEIFEIGSGTITYSELLQRCRKAIVGKKSLLLPVPFFAIGLSSWWLRLITGVPNAVGRALAEGLKCNTAATHNRFKEVTGKHPQNINAVLRKLAKEMRSP